MTPKLRYFGLSAMAPSMLQHTIPEPVTSTRAHEIKNKVSIVTNLKFNTSIDLMDWRPDSDHARFFWRFNEEMFVESLERGPSVEMRPDEWDLVTEENPEIEDAEEFDKFNYIRFLLAQERQDALLIPRISYGHIENVHGISGITLSPDWHSVAESEKIAVPRGRGQLDKLELSNYYKFQFHRRLPNKKLRLLGEYSLVKPAKRPRRERKHLISNSFYNKELTRQKLARTGPTAVDPYVLRRKVWRNLPLATQLSLARGRRLEFHRNTAWSPFPIFLLAGSTPLIRHKFQRQAQRKQGIPYVFKPTKNVRRLVKFNRFVFALHSTQNKAMASIVKIFIFTLTNLKLFVKGDNAQRLRFFLSRLIKVVASRLGILNNFYSSFSNYVNLRTSRAALTRNPRKAMAGSVKLSRFQPRIGSIKNFIFTRIKKTYPRSFRRRRLIHRLVRSMRAEIRRRWRYPSRSVLAFRRLKNLRSKPVKAKVKTSRPVQMRGRRKNLRRGFIRVRRRALSFGLVGSQLPLLFASRQRLLFWQRAVKTLFGRFKDLYAGHYRASRSPSSSVRIYKVFDDEFEDLEEKDVYGWFDNYDFITDEDFCIYMNEVDKFARSLRVAPAPEALAKYHRPCETKKPKLGMFLSALIGKAGLGPRVRRWSQFHRHRRILRNVGLLNSEGTF